LFSKSNVYTYYGSAGRDFWLSGPQVVSVDYEKKKGRFRDFAFSTRNSEAVLKVVRQRIDKMK